MCDFKPGDEVICVQMDCAPDMVGRHFTVSSVDPEGFRPPGMAPLTGAAVHLVGVYTRDGIETGLWGWDAERFRKVQRRDLSAWLKTATKFEGPKRAKVDA